MATAQISTGVGVPSKEKPVQFFNHFVNRIIFYFLFSFSVCFFSVAVVVVVSFQYIKILCVLFVVVVVHVYLYSISYIGTIPHIYVCKVLHEKKPFLVYKYIVYILYCIYIKYVCICNCCFSCVCVCDLSDIYMQIQLVV